MNVKQYLRRALSSFCCVALLAALLPALPAAAADTVSLDFDALTVGDAWDGDETFVTSDLARDGVVARTVQEKDSSRYLLMTTQNTAASTGVARNRFRTKEAWSGSYTLEWDANNFSGVRFEVYLRTGGNVRVRQMNHKLYLSVEDKAKVAGSMQTVASKLSMQDGKWYTFKAEVNDQQITLTVYDKSNENALLDTLTLKMDTSTLANLLDPYSIWFDMWGAAVEDTGLKSVALDSLYITEGTYEGVKSAPHAYDPDGSNVPAASDAELLVSEDFSGYNSGDPFTADDQFTVAATEKGGAIAREIISDGGNKYLRLAAWNSEASTGAARNQVKTVVKVSDTFTVEWDYNNVSSSFPQYFETYLRTGGNIRVRVDANGVPRIRVLNAAVVPGVMEDAVSDVALKTNNWYTFKVVVSSEKIVLDIYDKENGNAKVDTLSIVQDDSTLSTLFNAYNIWFDLWGHADVSNTKPAAVAVDNFRLYQGTYEGVKNAAISTPAASALADDAEAPGAAVVKCASGLTNCPAKEMLDVGKSAWYHKAVDYALTNGIMGGYNFYTFGPYDTLSRAMVAQALYNKEGQPAVSGSHGFTDVAAGQWYNNAITWATQNGVMGGYGDGKFGPDDDVTVEQVAVILWNYSGNPAFTASADSVGAHSGWAANGLAWGVETGLFEGMPCDAVTDAANRAQTAQMLMNYLSK